MIGAGVKLLRGPPALHQFAVTEIKDKHILDTSAWNWLSKDPERDRLVEVLRSKVVLPTVLSLSELAATEKPELRLALVRMVKTVTKDNRPLAMPNQLIIQACRGYSRHDAKLLLNAGDDCDAYWIALNEPERLKEKAREAAWRFNQESEAIFRTWYEGLRERLESDFKNGAARPTSFAALFRHLSKSDDFIYHVIVNPIYELAVGSALPMIELWPLINSLSNWRMFLISYAHAMYNRAIKRQDYGHHRNPGYLDLWSATYLPSCDIFVTADKRHRRALKVINRASSRPARVLSYAEWRRKLAAAG